MDLYKGKVQIIKDFLEVAQSRDYSYDKMVVRRRFWEWYDMALKNKEFNSLTPEGSVFSFFRDYWAINNNGHGEDDRRFKVYLEQLLEMVK